MSKIKRAVLLELKRELADNVKRFPNWCLNPTYNTILQFSFGTARQMTCHVILEESTDNVLIRGNHAGTSLLGYVGDHDFFQNACELAIEFVWQNVIPFWTLDDFEAQSRIALLKIDEMAIKARKDDDFSSWMKELIRLAICRVEDQKNAMNEEHFQFWHWYCVTAQFILEQKSADQYAQCRFRDWNLLLRSRLDRKRLMKQYENLLKPSTNSGNLYDPISGSYWYGYNADVETILCAQGLV